MNAPSSKYLLWAEQIRAVMGILERRFLYGMPCSPEERTLAEIRDYFMTLGNEPCAYHTGCKFPARCPVNGCHGRQDPDAYKASDWENPPAPPPPSPSDVLAAANRVENEIRLHGDIDPFAADLQTLVDAVRAGQPPGDDLQQAVRLLHVVNAWYWRASDEADSARADPLYPSRGTSSNRAPLFTAISDLLKRYPYGGNGPTKGAKDG